MEQNISDTVIHFLNTYLTEDKFLIIQVENNKRGIKNSIKEYLPSKNIVYKDIVLENKDFQNFKQNNCNYRIVIADDNFDYNKLHEVNLKLIWSIEYLDLRAFVTKIKEHLSIYKKKTLKVSSHGKYRNGNTYSHILPKEQYNLNIINNYSDEFFNSKFKNIKLHDGFPHLNSSQAMCINFFYPLIVEKKLDIIFEILAININEDEIEKALFEKESDLEVDKQSKTNFDFYIKLKSGVQVFFEIKYTEADFGSCKKDQGHINDFNKVYKNILDNSTVVNSNYKDIDFFFKNYQIMRNIIHIDKNSYVVVIYLEDNKKIRDKAHEIKNNVVEASYNNHFIIKGWNDIYMNLKQQLGLDNFNNSSKLKQHYDEFYEKYLNY